MFPFFFNVKNIKKNVFFTRGKVKKKKVTNSIRYNDAKTKGGGPSTRVVEYCPSPLDELSNSECYSSHMRRIRAARSKIWP